MKNYFFALALGVLITLVGCSSKGTGVASFPTSDGAYSGQGTFSAGQGSMKITATLTLNADKTYELKLNELSSLGREVGSWSQAGQQITLTPEPERETNQTLKAMSSNKQPHTVTINSENTEITWSDGPMSIKFVRADANKK